MKQVLLVCMHRWTDWLEVGVEDKTSVLKRCKTCQTMWPEWLETEPRVVLGVLEEVP